MDIDCLIDEIFAQINRSGKAYVVTPRTDIADEVGFRLTPQGFWVNIEMIGRGVFKKIAISVKPIASTFHRQQQQSRSDQINS